MTQAATRPLAERHRAILRDQSGVSDDVIGERGYFTIEEFSEARALGFKESQCAVPAMAIPQFDVLGDLYCHVLRHDEPRFDREGRPIRYDWPAGKVLILDVPPRCRGDLSIPDIPLYVTEGTKKADAIASKGGCAISLNGVAGWRGKNLNNGKTALGDWEHIAVNSREIILAFDSDAVMKQPVAYELHRLCVYLMSRKAGSIKVLYLPPLDDGSKQGVDDFLGAGRDLDDLVPYLKAKVEYVVPAKASDGKPNIITNGREHAVVVDELWHAALEAEEKQRHVFVRNETLCRIAASDSGHLSIVDLGVDEWIFYIERIAHAMTLTATGSLIPSGFTQKVARDMLVAWKKPEGLPRLAGIAEAPFFGRDGQLVTQHGYDPATGIYLNLPTMLRGIRVPETPSEGEVGAAVATWFDVLEDFPFVDEADRANAVAFALTAFVRAIFDDVSPLHLVTATTKGSGKGLLINVLNWAATGRDIGCLTMPWRSDEEVDKRFTSMMNGGTQSVHFDNVEGKIDSPILASWLTARVYESRVLGSSTKQSWPQRITSFMSGNNVTLGGDIPRRVVPTRLAPPVERPDLRPPTAFKHPNLVRYCSQNRREIVAASLILVQNWIARGMVPGDETMGSFEKWAATMGGILRDAGIDGFLANREELMAIADVDTGGWHAAVHAWWEEYGPNPVTLAAIDKVIKEVDDSPVMPSGHKEESDKSRQARVGKALAKVRDRVFLGYRIELASVDSHAKQKLWRLRRIENVISVTTPISNLAAVSDTSASGRGRPYPDSTRGPSLNDFPALGENLPQPDAPSASICENDDCQEEDWRWPDGTVRHERYVG